MKTQLTTTLAALLATSTLLCAVPAFADAVSDAKAYVAKASQPNPPWTGPTSGPEAQTGKTIVYVSADQRNGGALGVSEGVEEAAKAIGWTLRVIDGQGSVSGRSAAMQQAIALQPDGIILGTVDANEQAEAIRQAHDAGIIIVGWHSTASAGASDKHPIFTTITTDPLEISRAAASLAVADSNGTANVVIFTDSVYEIAIAKSDAMADVIKACDGCKILSVEDTPLAETSNRMPPLTNSLLQRFGDEWTYSLTINDLPYDFMAPALISAGIAQDGHPRNISAGDGSEAAFQRIQQNFYQFATVAEPLHLHGWQAVDEMNRAFAGEPESGFVVPVHLFTPDNIKEDGGADLSYDPGNGYRDVYRKIWGVN
ncbi:substrate-binding domain-containing protein [Phaeovulum vinaykumarii]|uniref:Monosaccharide ABC transporter substrate-binding protein, CUT2 family n=1 Tax=Phaeovulum vinaykumarii TaxID=407234 RepID=A0A1N7N0J2_9RHOB|nr:substrate-binding domain-containing protein [Phaeovulum vinaykumarii]SIS91845.1 monosaccharide ABC transporter substrate-binding protein, CUT2 family [Phaeovulum vinaykumarii]SOC17862.1 monosaccharide ABC transporter substrate-binding protein (CUT2 family) [Phaeovulum vinaykumarii]